ncbi:MAG: SET domain-containing protein [Myxococcota bacterium]
MLYVETELRPSGIEGLGLFVCTPVAQGTVVANFGHGAHVLGEHAFLEAQARGDELMLKSGVRWIGDVFLYNPQMGHEEHLNHSSSPNLLYHCGICFAKRAIRAGEELTVDYKYFLS